jgi:phage terminase large subunit-like protein
VTPFTVEHFREWARELVLDNGEPWVVFDYFSDFLEDYFAGVPENWLLVPEGNAKTTSLAGLAIYCNEFRPQAWIPWAASSRDQAEIGYRQAEGFVLRSPRLRSLMKCQEGYRRIKNLESGGRIQVFAADDGHADGIIPTDAFLDELHRHKNMRLYRTWRGKLGKRGGQMAAISTAGEPGGEFESARERIREMTPEVERRPGFVRCRSEHISLHEHAVPAGGDVEDMATVKLANPSPAITVEALASKRGTPTMTVEHWSRFVCNLPTRDGHAAISDADWYGAEVAAKIPVGEPVWVGLDVGWKWDTTSLVPLWMRSNEFRLFGPAVVLTPPRDGSMLDGRRIEVELEQIHAVNPIRAVVMDMHNAEATAQWIDRELGVEVFERAQSTSSKVEEYNAFTEALRKKWLFHTGDAALTRHVMNAVLQILPKGDARFARASQSRAAGAQDSRVIDALDAAAMAHVVAVAAGRVSEYRTVGFS